MSTAVVYHFLPHYRRAVMSALIADPAVDAVLYADRDGAAVDPTIAAWTPGDAARFVRTRLRRLPGGLLWQGGLIRLALSPRHRTVIYLGDPHFPATWISAVLARALGKRVLFWTHGWIRREPGLKGWIRRRFHHLAHGLLLYGRRARALGLAEGFPPERLHVIYNSLDAEAQAAAYAATDDAARAATRRALFAGDDATPVVVCTTRLTRLRRLDLLIDAAALLNERGRRVRLLLVGDGPERAALEAHASARGVAATFTGAVYDEERLAALIGCANCTVAPGKIGLTAMHSLVFGVPALTHDDADEQMPEWEAIVPGVTGALFRRDDVAAIADAIAQWTAAPWPAPAVRAACTAAIARFYHPAVQCRLIAAAVRGADAPPVAGERLQPGELAP
jgi:glycosyltransferase involved in cell wall biosynthesis